MKKIMAGLTITLAACTMAQTSDNQPPKALSLAKVAGVSDGADAPNEARFLTRPQWLSEEAASRVAGLSNDRILVGRSGAMSSESTTQGLPVSAAIKAYFEEVNAKGGVHGRKIDFIDLDDNYDPKKAEANAKALINDKKVFALLTGNATGGSRNMAKVANEARVPMIGSTSGAVQRDKKDASRYFFNVRNSNYDDMKGITRFLRDNGDLTLSVIYQEDAFGKAGLADLELAAQEDGVKILARSVMKSNDKDALDEVADLMRQGGHKTNNVVTILTDKPTLSAIKALRPLNKRVYAISSSGDIHTGGIEAVGNVVISQTAPPLRGTAHSGVNHFRMLMSKAAPLYMDSVMAFQGFLAAAIFVEALKDAGRNVDREKIVDALEKFNQREIEGMFIDYSTPLHRGTSYQELFMWDTTGRMIY